MDDLTAVPSKLGASAVASGAHTPEPWREQFGIVYGTENGEEEVILQLFPEGSSLAAGGRLLSDRQVKNLRRIVACVNACAGFGTGVLRGEEKGKSDE